MVAPPCALHRLLVLVVLAAAASDHSNTTVHVHRRYPHVVRPAVDVGHPHSRVYHPKSCEGDLSKAARFPHAQVTVHSACAAGCEVRGTCYAPSGRCDCPFGWSGPACNNFTEYEPPKQHRCFAQDKTKFQCGEGAGRGFCTVRWGTGMERKKEIKCECVTGWKGETCDERQPLVCMGDCGCYGDCVQGFCKCQAGHFGVDCMLTLGDNGQIVRKRCHTAVHGDGGGTKRVNEEELPEGCALDPMIYVYELPPQFNTWLVADPDNGWLRTTRKGGTAAHPSLWPGDGYVGPAELFLWERLLASDHRTLDPNQADFFFVPTLSRPATGGFFGLKGRWEPLEQPGENKRRARHPWLYWEDVVGYLRETWPFWDASGGKDHIFVFSGDHGACESPRKMGIPPALLPAILMSHWGNTFNTAGLMSSEYPYLDKGPCYRPHHDIVIPPPQQHDLTRSSLIGVDGCVPRLGPDTCPQPPRTTVLFFAGKRDWGETPYSHGVRQRVFDLFAGREPGFKVQPYGSDDDLRQSVFCLAPSGLAFGDRLFQAIAYGCIPVVIQDNVTQAFEDDLPFDEFSVRVAEVDIPQLPQILKALIDHPAGLVAAKQRALACVWPRFAWSSVYGASGIETGRDDAFATLLLALRNRRDHRGAPPPSAQKNAAWFDQHCLPPAADPHYPVRHAPLCRAYHPGRVTATLDGGLTLPGSTVPAKACTGDNCCARGQTQATAQPWPPGGALHT